MADTSPNSSASQSNIDDLVKELSRPQGYSSPTGGSAPSSQPSSQPTPVPSALPTLPPTPLVPQSRGSSIPQPPPGGTGGIGTTPPPPQAGAPKEYQSSIRTMSDDLTKLKAGQQPQGVNVPRKIDNTPVPIKPASPVAPVPAPSKSMPTSSMPSATKSAPMPSMPNQVSKTPTPTPIPRPVMPSMPPAIKTPATKLDQKNQFYVPPAEAKPVGSSSRNLVFVGIAVAVVLLGGLYWFFMIRDSNTEPVATASPVITFTPRPTATPNPDVLSTIFTTKGGTIVLPSSGDPTAAFNNGISAQPNITQGTLTGIDIVSGASVSGQTLTISGLLNRFVASYPTTLSAVLGQNYKFLLYGQKESFDSKGRPVTNTAPGSRL